MHVTHSAVARRGMFIVDRVILRYLTQAPLLGGPFCRSLRCVVCISETAFFCASMLAHGFLFFSTLFPNAVLGRFQYFHHTFTFSIMNRQKKASGATSCGSAQHDSRNDCML